MKNQSSLPEMRFTLDTLIKDVSDIKKRLDQYVPLRENDLQLKVIQETVDRTSKRLGILSEKIQAQEFEMQKQEASTQKSQTNLQIKILWGTVSTIIGLLASILVGYISHLLK